MRFACGDMRDHIVSYQNDHRPSYWRRRALRQQARLRIDFSEILRVVRFSTFATISARNRHAGAVRRRLLLRGLCCKSPKMWVEQFFAKRQNKRQLSIDVATGPPANSPVS